MAVCVSVMVEGYPAVPMRLPSSGLRKAHGSYQLALVLVLTAQLTSGLEGSGVPLPLNGWGVGLGASLPLASVLLLGETVNGVPLWAAKVRLDDQPPTVSSAR